MAAKAIVPVGKCSAASATGSWVAGGEIAAYRLLR